MKYVYECKCGFTLIFETDTKAPGAIKCKQCGVKLKGKKIGE